MGDTTIEWADKTFNPWIGCQKVSPGCANCYAERDWDKRFGRAKWGPKGTRTITAAANWRQPLKWDREAKRTGRRLRVFCASLADVFEDWGGPITTGKLGEVLVQPNLRGAWGRGNWLPAWPEDMERDPQGWKLLTMDDVRVELFKLIESTPNLDWLLLTKRPENIKDKWPKAGFADIGGPKWLAPLLRFSNVWLGTTTENQEQANERIPDLILSRHLCERTFLSCEPLLGPVDLPLRDGIDWVIAGGESGPDARPSHPDWFRSIRDQCQAAGVPFLFKQWGEFQEGSARDADAACVLSNGEVAFPDSLERREAINHKLSGRWDEYKPTAMAKVGKKRAGRTLDGQVWNEVPTE